MSTEEKLAWLGAFRRQPALAERAEELDRISGALAQAEMSVSLVLAGSQVSLDEVAALIGPQLTSASEPARRVALDVYLQVLRDLKNGRLAGKLYLLVMHTSYGLETKPS